MSSQRKKEERKRARELEQQQREKKEATIKTVKRILIAAIAIAAHTNSKNWLSSEKK